jgi:hypothetical protein
MSNEKGAGTRDTAGGLTLATLMCSMPCEGKCVDLAAGQGRARS